MKNLLFGLVFLAYPTAFAACSKPAISLVNATPDFTGQKVTITWTTSIAADSLVGYGINNGANLTPIGDSGGATKHSVTISGLLPRTNYGFEIRSRAISAGSPCASADWAFYGDGNSANFTTSDPPPGSFDFYVVPAGSHHVTQGYRTYFELQLGTLVGTYSPVKMVVTGLPPNTAVRWPNTQDFLSWGPNTVTTTNQTNDTFTSPQSVNTELELDTNSGGTTPPGNYTLTITGSGPGMPTHAATWPLTVDPVSAPFGIATSTFGGIPTSYPAIPNLASWTAALTTYGTYNCAEDEDASPRTVRPNDNANLCGVSVGQTKCSWFYDGQQAYFDISNYLSQQPQWQQCRDNVNAIYRDGYVIPNNGNILVILMFPKGLYNDYQINGTAADLTALDDLDGHTYNPSYGVAVPARYLQRESAYSLRIDYYENKLGRSVARLNQGTPYWQSYWLDHTLSHLDQICYTQNAEYWESFMVGLEAESLITYYEDGHQGDVRIPSAIKCVADYMFNNAWNVISDDQGAFQYSNWRGLTNEGIANAGASSFVLEDMLIAPMYAWLYKMTGLTQYQTEGDLIWGYGSLVKGASGGQPGGFSQTIGATYPANNSGKQFSQYMYWSPQYLRWRSARPASAASVVTSPNPSPFGQVVTFTATVSPSPAGANNILPIYMPTGTVQFKDGTTPLGSPVPLTGGAATMMASGLSVGTHSITAVYSGDSNFQPVTSPVFSHIMVKASSFTAASLVNGSSSSNPSSSPATLTFAVTVTPQFAGSAIPSGTIQFMDGSSALGSPVVLSAGAASLMQTISSPGLHPISLAYAGDGNFEGSTSSVFSQVVLSGGSVTSSVAFSANASSTNPVKVYFGFVAGANGADFVARVTPTAATGNVVLLEGNTQLGPLLPLSSGQTPHYRTQLPVGQHNLRAVYIGDGTNAGNTSTVLVVDRSPMPRPN